MKRIKIENYYIIKIRVYASKHYVNRLKNNDLKAIKNQTKAYEKYSDFFWKLIEKVTGKEFKYYSRLYFLNSRECAREELQEQSGIIMIDYEGWVKILIPKIPNKKLFDWILETSPKPYLVQKKGRFNWIDSTPTTWRREQYKMDPDWFDRLKD